MTTQFVRSSRVQRSCVSGSLVDVDCKVTKRPYRVQRGRCLEMPAFVTAITY